MSIKVPKLSEDFLAQVRETQEEMERRDLLARKAARRAARRKWLSDNIVGILALLVAVAALLIPLCMPGEEGADPLLGTQGPEAVSVEPGAE